MAKKTSGLLAVIGGSAVIAAAAAGIGIAQGSSSDSISADDMTTGQTVTRTTAPSKAPIAEATPEIKGPAPLPVEQQGVPG